MCKLFCHIYLFFILFWGGGKSVTWSVRNSRKCFFFLTSLGAPAMYACIISQCLVRKSDVEWRRPLGAEGALSTGSHGSDYCELSVRPRISVVEQRSACGSWPAHLHRFFSANGNCAGLRGYYMGCEDRRNKIYVLCPFKHRENIMLVTEGNSDIPHEGTGPTWEQGKNWLVTTMYVQFSFIFAVCIVPYFRSAVHSFAAKAASTARCKLICQKFPIEMYLQWESFVAVKKVSPCYRCVQSVAGLESCDQLACDLSHAATKSRCAICIGSYCCTDGYLRPF